jgi:hypothetical protein
LKINNLAKKVQRKTSIYTRVTISKKKLFEKAIVVG